MCLAAALPHARAAALPDPDLGPLVATIGLPDAAQGGILPGRGELAWRVSSATASHSVQDADGGEIVRFDGETTRFALTLETGVSDRLSLGIEVPYLLHESGGLDGFISSWHDWFGLPNGLRDLVEDDRIDFRYQDAGALRLDVQNNRRGRGDLRLLAGWQLARSPTAATALRLQVELPTGASGELAGSGGTDLSLALAGDYRELGGRHWLSGHYRAGLTRVGEPDRLPGRARSLIGTLSGGLGLRVSRRLTLAAQATIRSKAYESALQPLGEPGVLLYLGGHIDLGRRLRLSLGVGEDVNVDSAPDVTLGLSLAYRPRAD